MRDATRRKKKARLTARQLRRERRRQIRDNHSASEEHKISIEILCWAFSRFGSIDDGGWDGVTARAWSDIGWWPRWLRTWRDIGIDCAMPRFYPVKQQMFEIGPVTPEPMTLPSAALFYMDFSYHHADP